MLHLLDLFIAGLTRGSIYALIAVGYTMVYGIIGLINFAHGEIYMLGAFVGLIASGVLSVYGFHGPALFAISLTIAIVYAAAVGTTVNRIAYRPLTGAPRLSALISAIGMSFFLQNFVLVTQGPEFRAYPNLINELLGISQLFFDPDAPVPLIPHTSVAILIAACLSMAALFAFIRLTRTGRAMRATAQDQTMAKLLGINVNQAVTSAFLIGSSCAGLGGVLVAAHAGQINFHFGFIIGIKAFTAAVLGGIGSLPGALLGGLVLGMIESFTTGFLRSDYEDVIAFLVLVTILVFKPEGLLGRSAITKV